MVNETECDKASYVNLIKEHSEDSEAEKDFGERIRTYIDGQKWVRKPFALAPPVCAQYGWKCITSDMLECVTCHAKLSVCHPEIKKYEAYKACIDEILKDLKEKHKKHCPWPLSPSPDTLLKIIQMPKEEALHQFLKRLKSCLNNEYSLPHVKESTVSELGLDDISISSLCKIAEINADDINRIGRSLVCLAAAGWSVTSENKNGKTEYITCTNCQRVVWVHCYNLINSAGHQEKSEINSCVEKGDLSNISENKDIAEKNESDEPPLKKRKILLEKIDFNPLEEHRPWCLWICEGDKMCHSKLKENESLEEKEDETSKLPGWRIFIKSLLRNISTPDTSVQSPSKEKLRNVRDLIGTWPDPFA